MKHIQLTQDKHAIVDDEDFDLLNQSQWFYGGRGYAGRYKAVDGKESQEKMHRVIMNAPDGLQVDHINGNRLDNRKANLRIVSHQQNQMNRKATTGASGNGLKGITYRKRYDKWEASIQFNNKNVYLGTYATPEEAARAYDMKALELFGEFARPNFHDKPEFEFG